MGERGYPENTVAIATVRGVENVLVLRRRCFPIGHGSDWFDWSHTNVVGFTCSNDEDVEVKQILQLDQ